MAKYLTRRILCYRFVIPVAAAGGVLALLLRLLSGPVLGAEYDFLAASRPAAPIAREILIIETGAGAQRVLSPALTAQVALTLTEFEAATLIILAPVLGVHHEGEAGASELVFHVDEEFKTIGGNIKNLFEGIRMGSIAPEDAPRFVSEVLRLTGQSKERLLLSATQSLETEEIRMEKALAVFGEVRVPSDIQMAIAGNGADDAGRSALYTAGYSRTAADSDGKIRRIVPFTGGAKASEHVVWAALKSHTHEEQDLNALFDSTGALIVEMPKEGGDFRTIALSLFLEYEDLDLTLSKLLASELDLAGYAGILPDRYPAFLAQKAAGLRESLLAEHDEERKARWIEAREQYANALAAFFTDDIRRNIARSFDDLARDEALDEARTEKLLQMRDDELQKYDIAREVYRELTLIREKLETSLRGSFCILGSSGAREGEAGGAAASLRAWEGENPVRISALLANTMLTGAAISVVDRRDTIMRSALPALITLLIMLKLRLFASAIIAVFASFFVYAGFAYGFIFTGRWLDPLIPALSTAAAALSSLLCALSARAAMAVRIRLEFAAVISPRQLRRIIRAKKALPEKNNMSSAAIVAIRSPRLSLIETKESAQTAVEKLEQFRAEVKAAFTGKGAVIIGCDGDTVMAAFGSPLERFAFSESRKVTLYNDEEETGGSAANWQKSSADKAARLIRELSGKSASSDWCFGLDWGKCHFTWTALTGYSAAGRPAARARLLARACQRYQTTTLITSAAARKTDPALIKKTEALGKPRGYWTLVPQGKTI